MRLKNVRKIERTNRGHEEMWCAAVMISHAFFQQEMISIDEFTELINIPALSLQLLISRAQRLEFYIMTLSDV